MLEAFLKALFVAAGLMLIRQLWDLLRLAEHPVARAAIHAVMGWAALLTANTVGAMAGLGVGLNGLTLPVAVVLGVPGVVLLWCVRYFI